MRKPYYGLSASGIYNLIGSVRLRGVEASLSSEIGSNLRLLLGGLLLWPRVDGEAVALGKIGPRAAGLSKISLRINADFRVPIIPGLSIDASMGFTDSKPTTNDNRVWLPSRAVFGLGSRYRFALSGRKASLRVQASNLTNVGGFEYRSPGAYDIVPARAISAYFSVDF